MTLIDLITSISKVIMTLIDLIMSIGNRFVLECDLIPNEEEKEHSAIQAGSTIPRLGFTGEPISDVFSLLHSKFTQNGSVQEKMLKEPVCVLLSYSYDTSIHCELLHCNQLPWCCCWHINSHRSKPYVNCNSLIRTLGILFITQNLLFFRPQHSVHLVKRTV